MNNEQNKHDEITIENLNTLFIKYLKKEGVFGKYMSYLYHLMPHIFFHHMFFIFITSCWIEERTFLNENLIRKIYTVEELLWLTDYIDDEREKKHHELRDFLEQHIDAFFKFLKKCGYTKYIVVCNHFYFKWHNYYNDYDYVRLLYRLPKI